MLGGLFAETGRIGRGEEMLRASLAMQIHLLGRKHLDVTETERRLAALLRDGGSYAEADSLSVDVFETRIELLGERHVAVAEALADMGASLLVQNDLPGARMFFEHALSIRRELLGDTHPIIAEDLNNIAVIEMSAGDFIGAEPLLREALFINRWNLGVHHAEVGFALSQLAINLSEQLRYDEAAPMYREALEIFRDIDPDHPEIRWINYYRGYDAMGRGDLDTAESCFRQVIDWTQKVYGAGHESLPRLYDELEKVKSERLRRKEEERE
jgi:tetratricopeptide (TPR) repeat protein